MEFKFRDRVKVKEAQSKILRPDSTVTQAGFFAGTEGIVIRHDPQKGGYLVVLDCPEVSSAMGETITAYFNEYELDPAPMHYTPEYQTGTPDPMTQYQITKAKNNRAKRLGDV